jgi:hypothetical protein
MHWPQITLIVLFAAGTGMAMVKHGEPQCPHNIWTTLIATAITVGLLIAGGFFNQV